MERGSSAGSAPSISFGVFLLITRGLAYSVARDFVEAPSQMLENWGWEPKVLEKISSHFETQEPLPDDLIKKLIKRFAHFPQGTPRLRAVLLNGVFWDSRYVNAGLFYLRQLFFATYDIKVHTDKGTYPYKKPRKTTNTSLSCLSNEMPPF